MSDVWLSIVMVVVFVLIGGVFSGAEIALVSLRESQVRGMAESGRRGQAVQRLLSDPNRFLAAVQVGVTFAGFFSAAFGAATLAAPLAGWLERRGLSEGLAGTVALVLVTIAISYVSLVVGELTPKRLALQRAEGFSLIVAAPLNAIATLFRPVIWLLSKSTNVLVRLLGGDPRQSGESISQEELRDLVAAHESLSSDERRLIDEVFRAGEREIREVMTPAHRGRLPRRVDDRQPGGQAGRRLQLVALPGGRPRRGRRRRLRARPRPVPAQPPRRPGRDRGRPRPRGEAAARHQGRAGRAERDAAGEPPPRDRRRRVRRHRRDRHPGGPHRGGHRGDLRRVRRGGHPRRQAAARRAREVDGLLNLDDFTEATGLRAARRALRDRRRLRARRARPAARGRRHHRGRGPDDRGPRARRTADLAPARRPAAAHRADDDEPHRAATAS